MPEPKIVARMLHVDKLRVSKLNPRRTPGDVAELADSIKQIGILQPLVVTPDGNGSFLVLAGSRRLAAAKRAGLRSVPVVVHRFNETEREIAMLVENVQREQLSPVEEASVYVRLMKLNSWTQAQVGERVGKSQAHVGRYIALLRLPKDIIGKVDRGEIGLYEALGLGAYRVPYSVKPKQPQGRKSRCSIEGHDGCDGRRCEVRRLAARVGAR
jgi:ParB family chromosome partitioning protein